LFIDAGASEVEREEAWGALEERIRPPVLQELRRHLEGRRLVEHLADDLCTELRDACEGLGGGEPRLRERVADEVRRTILERQGEGEVGEEFDRDWAGSLFLAALHGLERSHPGAYLLLLRLYDQPEGGAPPNIVDLAVKLGLPPENVVRDLEEGRRVLLELFEREIADTVADPAVAAEERELLLPYAGQIFGNRNPVPEH
jgi:hypothetical protein